VPSTKDCDRQSDPADAIDSGKLQKELGWSPIPRFADGLEKTVDWYLSNQRWLDRVLSGDYGKYYDEMYAGR